MGGGWTLISALAVAVWRARNAPQLACAQVFCVLRRREAECGTIDGRCNDLVQATQPC